MNILILYTRLTGYWMSCMRFDHGKTGNRYLVVRKSPSPEAPFALASENGIEIIDGDGLLTSQLFEISDKFNPDLIYLSGWSDNRFKKLAMHYKGLNRPVIMGMDNQWLGNLKQKVASSLSQILVRKYCTHIWIPGNPQFSFAQNLGFKSDQILTGLYCANDEVFSQIQQTKFIPQLTFIGRLVEHKGLLIFFEVLKELIREENLNLKIRIIGSGPLEVNIPVHSNISHIPFMAPEKLPDSLKDAGFFILPSLYEAWGVVLHEAVLAGLPVISTYQTGASSEFLIHRFNGFIYNAPDRKHLKEILLNIQGLNEMEYLVMSQNSKKMASRIGMNQWSATINSVLPIKRKHDAP